MKSWLCGVVLSVASVVQIMGAESGGIEHRWPEPIGIGVNYYVQNQGYDLKSLRVNVLANDLAALEGIEIDNSVTEINIKLDYWILPPVNLFAIVGAVDGRTDVETDLIPGLSVEYDGVVYGGGVTLAGGWGRYFASVTAALTETDLNTSESKVNAWIFSPRLGITSRYGALWVGGMLQETDEQHEGSIMLPIYGLVDYKVKFEQRESWNASMGLTTGIGSHWQIDLEAGFGDRTHASLSTTYRF